jgi:hypothetical protein
MICPHCGHENAEGRKYCRGCAKALASEPTAAKSVPPIPAQPVDSSSVPSSVNSSPIDPFTADSSFADSSFEKPVGPAISKKVIAIAAGLVVVIAGLVFWFTHKSDHGTNVQAEQAQDPINTVAYHPDPASLKNREYLMAALHLIVAQQEARLADDPDDLNVCAVNIFGDDDLGRHVRQSHYIIDQQCQPRTADGIALRNGFTVTAVPKSDSNPADAPSYCVDQTKIIRRYADAHEVNNATNVQHLTCPIDGQPVE